VGTAQTGFTFGLSMTSAASTGLIFSTAPVWGMLLGSMLGHERPTGRGVVGVALSIVGVGVVFYEGLGAGSTSLFGNLWVLLAAVSVGVYTVLSVLLLSSPQLLDFGWGSVGGEVWTAVGYSAVFATAFAFVGWQRGISRIGANRTLIYQYLITAVGVASGIVFFGETLGVDKVVGGAVILLGVYLARRQ
jgi:drug/metabolite transporter (DMT)-like permease